MEDFWTRVKYKIKESNTTMDWVAHKINIRADSFRRWSQRKTIPNAQKAYDIAKALNTSIEYLLTGEEPRHLSNDDILFFVQAKKWQNVIEDLQSLSPAIAESFCTNIHVVAQQFKDAVPKDSGFSEKGA